MKLSLALAAFVVVIVREDILKSLGHKIPPHFNVICDSGSGEEHFVSRMLACSSYLWRLPSEFGYVRLSLKVPPSVIRS